MGKRKYKPLHEKILIELDKELTKITRNYFASLCIVLHEKHGYREKRLNDIIDATVEAFFECADLNNKSMIQMLDEETGIELQNGDGKSWRDLEYLNDEKWNHKVPSKEKMIAVRINQRKWLEPQTMAGILLAMNRKHGFGAERCQRLYSDMMDAINERPNTDKVVQDCKDITGIDVIAFLDRKREMREGK